MRENHDQGLESVFCDIVFPAFFQRYARATRLYRLTSHCLCVSASSLPCFFEKIIKSCSFRVPLSELHNPTTMHFISPANMRPGQIWNDPNVLKEVRSPPLSPQMMDVRIGPSSFRDCSHAPRKRPLRGVSFAEEALLYSSDWTPEDVQASWYDHDELEVFKGERKHIVKTLKKVGFDLKQIDREKVCLRGYEPYFSVEMNKATKYARSLVMSVVLVEQERQRRSGNINAESLRERCCQASQWARDNALEMGAWDAEDNPLRSECLGRPCTSVRSKALQFTRISLVDKATVAQFENALKVVNSLL